MKNFNLNIHSTPGKIFSVNTVVLPVHEFILSDDHWWHFSVPTL